LSEARTALVRYRLEQADEALEGAQLLLDALLQIGYEHRGNTPTSGLVEQQRLFGKLRR
jgi:hypothetical protein